MEGISPPPLAQEKGRTRKRAHIHGHANATSNDIFLGPHIKGTD